MKAFAGKVLSPRASTRLQQMERANDVSMNEITRPGNGPIDVRFSRQMHDMGDAMLLDDLDNGVFVAQIQSSEYVFRVRRNFFEIGEMAGVGQAIEIDQSLDLRLVDNMLQDVRTDESCSAREK